MPQDHIRYDILAQDALRGVIRKVLSEVAATGALPGEHHFFITFLTNAPGVRISPQLKAKYDEQMTIVIQHQFWDLEISETQFEITLSFSDKAEKLVVPFAAIRGFYDPAVNFELEFDTEIEVEDNQDNADVTTIGTPKVISENETTADNEQSDAVEPQDEGAKPAAEETAGASVVSLDSFRKKN